jgi:hypothetical protein
MGSASDRGYASSDAGASSADGAFASDAAAAPPSVEVLSQKVVGPYESVILHSNDGSGQAINDWLTDNGFVIPDAILPVLTAYAKEGFDFIALRLRPDQDVRAMQPVRVVTPGADAALPLRMVAAGVGTNVGLSLYVIGEGRYHTQNFPDATIDLTKLVWDPIQSRSNYSTLAQEAMTTGDGRGWLTESSQPADLYAGGGSTSSTGAPSIGLYDAYMQACQKEGYVYRPCGSGDAGTVLATADGGKDGGTSGGDAGCMERVLACQTYDDLKVATSGMHVSDVWVTRLRAFLPATALDTDLVLGAAPEQRQVDPALQTTTYSVSNYDPCTGALTGASYDRISEGSTVGSTPKDDAGCACTTSSSQEKLPSYLLVAGTFFGLSVARTARRRRRTAATR